MNWKLATFVLIILVIILSIQLHKKNNELRTYNSRDPYDVNKFERESMTIESKVQNDMKNMKDRNELIKYALKKQDERINAAKPIKKETADKYRRKMDPYHEKEKNKPPVEEDNENNENEKRLYGSYWNKFEEMEHYGVCMVEQLKSNANLRHKFDLSTAETLALAKKIMYCKLTKKDLNTEYSHY